MKFEFGDLYKFIVSLGVVLLMSTVIMPWLFLREPFDILKSAQDIEKLTTMAQEIIKTREGVVLFVSKYLLLYSVVSFFLGGFLILYGLYKWRQNQLIIDEQTKIELEQKKRANRDATDDEVESKILLDAARQDSVPAREAVGNITRNYYEMESVVFKKFNEYYSDRYTVRRDRVIADVGIDILLEGNAIFTKDWIIEVKYIRKGFNLGWLRQSFSKNRYAKTIYMQFENKIPNTLLLVVVDDDAYERNKEKYNNMSTALESEGRRGKDNVVIVREKVFIEAKNEQFKEIVGI
ncbi:hypothetical protein KVO79_20235 [Serratia quinivorans]|uniref:hypothetical protein n=1 Tax=Serratia quinivorans TaxID=137545 RepID=UPI001C470C91|nr:hypothetical protein [Serratia quinivorans]MBV6694432.1 hypothetical protein [Serratia quinivorans]